MLTTLCITLLAYMLLGREIKPVLAKLTGVNWRRRTSELYGYIREYANRVGRTAVRPILQFYYVLTAAETSTADKAMMYAAIAYTVLPHSLLPQRVFKFLGILDEDAAVLFVYNKVKDRITPSINARVDATILKWFGHEYATIISEEPRGESK
jgi:uncharacterized membrane protein YkvA (DUF1232 family)